ncbi:hypothetical protein HJC23_008768 [Cyclotella cryptica]|uniref:Helicase-associated domain-containing protein n=1 Tax=Cyclotella cryptica TaxID=29204 RepID=A0ABD3PHD0_9STRA|eukprot:CCRYP_015690-RA/>CCRYP_015690-RA protein AED:0.30 eAED:-0.06 QI:0/-1/0/1/-1/1/1/0/239
MDPPTIPLPPLQPWSPLPSSQPLSPLPRSQPWSPLPPLPPMPPLPLLLPTLALLPTPGLLPTPTLSPMPASLPIPALSQSLELSPSLASSLTSQLTDAFPPSPDGTLCTIDLFSDFTYAEPRKSWVQWFLEMTEFKKKHGHCDVANDFAGGLGKWVSYQCSRRHMKSLNMQRVKLLEAIGFIWNRHDDVWDGRFSELKAYKGKHGHCEVPRTLGGLGKWVGTQRDRYEQKVLNNQRVNC